MEALRGHFRPEFLNRVDEIIIFDRLSDEEIRQIVGLQLDRLAKRLAAQNITLEVTPEASALVAREGYDPVYGARPLKRAIQREILDPLSLEILQGRFKEGDHIEVGGERRQNHLQQTIEMVWNKSSPSPHSMRPHPPRR